MNSLRICYLFVWNDFQSSGVPSKVASQVGTWAALGHHVSLHMMSQSPEAADWLRKTLEHSPSASGHLHKYRGALQRNSLLARILSHSIKMRADLVYSRHDYFIPSAWPFRNRLPLVLEINSDDVAEHRYLPLGKRAYSRLTRALPLRMAAGLVFVSRELANAPAFRGFEKPHVVIANGIDLRGMPEPSQGDASGTRLVFVGTGNQEWHGVDKILKLATHRPDWTFDLIGPRATDFQAAPENVRFRGPMTHGDSTKLMIGAHFAIGTLGLHRKSMNEASPLKVRHYLALGLPVISAHTDTDFPEGAPFLLSLPNEEDNVLPNLKLIDRFVEDWQGRRVTRNDIEHLDYRYKERARLEFFKGCALRNTNGARRGNNNE